MASRDSKKQYLLDDSSADAPSDDYLAYAGSADSDSGRIARRKKYIIGAIIAVVTLVILIAVIGYAVVHKEDESNTPPPLPIPDIANQFRLPYNVQPSYYNLSLRIDLDNLQFSGTVAITTRIVDTPMSAIVLHSLYLNILSLTLTNAGVVIPPASYAYFLYQQMENGTQYLVIQALDGLQFNVTETLIITVSFARDLPTNTSSGLYGVYYTDTRNGQRKPVAATQFEPTHSRRAFPNFDELQMKARFKVVMEVKQGLVALSNAPNISTELIADGWQVSEPGLGAVQR
jgi:Peptidase M1 N-terminal domain